MKDEHCPGARHAAGPSHLLSRALGACRASSVVLVFFASIALVCYLVGPAESSTVIHDTRDVLENYIVELNGKLYFISPSDRAWELITDINDPDIVNKGDGFFHPFSRTVVEEALSQVAYPIEAIPLQIFILPYPRRGILDSSARPGKIFLSPGVREYLPQQVHFTVTHEVGHIVHRHFMPDDNGELWQEYRVIRGITNTSVYNNTGMHRNRPTEIFAEDFRFLFGGELANYSGTIENADLPLPTRVEGLRDFFLSLPSGAPERRSPLLRGFPNPFNPSLNVSFTVGPFSTSLPSESTLVVSSGGAAFASSVGADQASQRVVLRIFDVSGRLVRTLLDDELLPGAYSAVWTGTDGQGKRVCSGIYFLSLEVGSEKATKKVILSR